MTSKIVVNNIEADAGVSTVTFNSNVERGSSNLHSTGLNVNDTFVHSTGIALGAGSTIGAVTGVTTYYGDGSQLTGAGPTLTNGANNRIVTATGANALNAQANLTYNGATITHNVTGGLAKLDVKGSVGGGALGASISLRNTNSANNGKTELQFQDPGSNVYAKIEGTNLTDGSNNGEIRFYTASATQGVTERLKISQEGYITKPNQPSFHVSRRGGDVSGNNYVVFDQVHHNNGNHYSTSNGRFTAPVTGVYFFSVYHFTGGSPHSAIRLNINGSQYGEYHWDDTGGCATWVAPMTSGQYAQIYTVSYTFRGTSDYHNGFNGYLIG